MVPFFLHAKVQRETKERKLSPAMATIVRIPGWKNGVFTRNALVFGEQDEYRLSG